MAFTVTLYSFSKKENSTAIPASGTDFACVLKHNSGILNPVITLDIGTTTAPGYNYAYIPAYGRYYFIDEWTWVENRLWSAQMSVDVLATYKSEIGASSLYILRSSAAYDGTVIDTIYPAKTSSTYQTVTGTDPFTENPASGVFVIGVAGSTVPTHGSLAYYAVDQSNMINLLSDLNNDFVTSGNGFDTADATEALQKALIDPFSYIKSCVWYPVSLGTLPITSYAIINLGGYDMTNSAGNYIAANQVYFAGSISLTMPDHPQIARGTYLNAAYRRITAMIPPFGTFEIDPSVACNYTTVYCDYHVDCTSGIGVADIGCGNGSLTHLLARVETKVGVPIQLNAVFRDYFNAASSLGSGIISAALFNPVAGLFNGVTSAINAARPIQQSMGSSGSYAAFYGTPSLYIQFMHLADEDNTRNGRPLCSIRTPSSLGGYMIAQNADIDMNGTAQEHQLIKSYLEGGFYYE